MRILRVAQKTYPDVEGGGPYHTHAMSRDQAARGHEVTLLTIRTDPELPHVEARDGYTVVRYDPAMSPLGNDVSPDVAQYLAWADAFDVVHAHSHLYFSTNLAALKRALGDIPLAITNHGLYSQNAPEWAFNWYLKTLGRWTFNRADVVFCYTTADEERVREFGVTTPIEVVSNGIDTERFAPEGPRSDLVAGDGTTVLFVGRLVEGKRPEVVIQAVDQLDDEHDIELYVCGDGPLRSALEAEAGPRVTFLGDIPYDEMPSVYRAADLLVLPSRAEGVPRTIMEALTVGIPVVSSDLPQVRSCFGDAITYFPDRDAEALSRRMLEALNGEGRPSFEGTFSWERTVSETTAALESIADVDE